ncbi:MULTISPECIES: hypothetical protein [unclassified Pseudonocardia]|uniref:hypothetical protein n=1 Tax=unclassified Pseudonocardia TaxID=2619320 RepID=UPI0011AE935A|nr:MULTISPECIES: hypothetical protein [unclassified Pseudonocardia]
MTQHADEAIQAEVLDLLLMGPETTAALAAMLDETTESQVLKSHPSVYSGVSKATSQLERENLIRKSAHFRDNWELTDHGTARARLSDLTKDESLDND